MEQAHRHAVYMATASPPRDREAVVRAAVGSASPAAVAHERRTLALREYAAYMGAVSDPEFKSPRRSVPGQPTSPTFDAAKAHITRAVGHHDTSLQQTASSAAVAAAAAPAACAEGEQQEPGGGRRISGASTGTTSAPSVFFDEPRKPQAEGVAEAAATADDVVAALKAAMAALELQRDEAAMSGDVRADVLSRHHNVLSAAEDRLCQLITAA
eukprot:TRINITY_DN4360_c0_g1_i4.p1 TRINITY_DN4360_c0_g1~~TRINITY_DN4360_c0_g1_i4.p1  ORF type:complete len:236 (+),score=79.95 TRINITY_DN4360_c0_g1_i4:71-709(+)